MAYPISQEPSSASYRESGHDGFRLFPVDGGPPRTRMDKARSNPVVDLVWDVFSLDFTRLTWAYTYHRHDELEIAFVSAEYGHDTYLCRMIPSTFGWRPNGDTAYSVFCSVEVLGSVGDKDQDEAILDFGTITEPTDSLDFGTITTPDGKLDLGGL